MGQGSAMSVRSLCIPSHRLQGGSGLAIYGRRPAWMNHGFTGGCKIVLPNWTLQHFRALGVTLDGLGIKKDGTRSKAAWLADHIRHHTFRLVHATTQTTAVVTVFTCPAHVHGPLHASVGWLWQLSHRVAEVWLALPLECCKH